MSVCVCVYATSANMHTCYNSRKVPTPHARTPSSSPPAHTHTVTRLQPPQAPASPTRLRPSSHWTHTNPHVPAELSTSQPPWAHPQTPAGNDVPELHLSQCASGVHPGSLRPEPASMVCTHWLGLSALCTHSLGSSVVCTHLLGMSALCSHLLGSSVVCTHLLGVSAYALIR